MTFSSLLFERQHLCLDCLSKFEVRNEKFKIDNIEVHILYKYNEFFKELLFRYKGNYDYGLKFCFLNQFKSNLLKSYKGYTLLPAPSSKESNKKRNFNHVEEIFKSLKLNMVKCFLKTENWKQSSKNKNERNQIQKVIKINKAMLRGIDKVLIVDDVSTTLSTIKALIRLIPTNIDIKVLVLSSNCQIKSIE